MTFNGKTYTQKQCDDIFQFLDTSEIGEYMRYYDKIVFHTDAGFIAAYSDDLSNYWDI